ncbi:flavodoxin domain-containing protein [Gorillibacterium sp. sgz5001074]|uniref:flavodoxin domain-containing protein n=1 Tax=Gorillibacterium sp. sgz5001074 TaxID=3446695 RepID=UPI003F66B63A
MRTLIVYATKYGCTEKCAGLLKHELAPSGEVDCVNLKKMGLPDLSRYDRVIIGGSIYAGGIQKEVRSFCATHLPVLLQKRIGLFICCMQEGETAERELLQSFPAELAAHASAKEPFGGEFIFKRMSLLDRFIAWKVAKIETDTSTLSEEKIRRFTQQITCA